jgi:hypothetical protein
MKKTILNSNQKCKLVKTIEQTYDYDKYENLPGINRPVIEGHVKKLFDSFSAFGTAGSKIIVIRTKSFNGKISYYLADGQHTVVAAGRLNLPLTIMIVELYEDTLFNVTQYIAILNNNHKAWSTKNYLKTYSYNNIVEYKMFGDVISNTGLTITDMLHIFTGGGGIKQNKLFKDGELTFTNVEDSNRLLNAVVKVLPYVPTKAYTRRSMYKVFRMTKDYNRFAEAIIKTSKSLADAHTKFSENETDFHKHLVRIFKSEFKVVE